MVLSANDDLKELIDLNNHHGQKLKQLLEERKISIREFSIQLGKSRNWGYMMLTKPRFDRTIASAISLFFGVNPNVFGIFPEQSAIRSNSSFHFTNNEIKNEPIQSEITQNVIFNNHLSQNNNNDDIESLKLSFRQKEESYLLREKNLLKMIAYLTENLIGEKNSVLEKMH